MVREDRRWGQPAPVPSWQLRLLPLPWQTDRVGGWAAPALGLHRPLGCRSPSWWTPGSEPRCASPVVCRAGDKGQAGHLVVLGLHLGS